MVRDLNKNRGNRRFLRLFSIAGHAMFFLSAGARWGVWGEPHGLDRSGLQWCDADDRRCGRPTSTSALPGHGPLTGGLKHTFSSFLNTNGFEFC